MADTFEMDLQPFDAEYEIEHWSAYRRSEIANGYTTASGRSRGLIDGQSIDAAVAHQAICPVHNKPSAFHALYLVEDGRNTEYRAFAVCVECDRATEF